MLASGGEGLDQALPHPFAGHLDQSQRGDLGDLVACPVAPQALHEPAQHEVPVGLQDHVDEVDDNHAADIAQAQLADDLLGGLQVVAGDGLLQRAPRAGEAPGVDVDDGHRLGAVDDQGAAAGEPDLAIEALGELLVDAVGGEDVLGPDPVLEALGQIRADLVDVLRDRGPGVVPGDDELAEVLVEDVADDSHGELGLTLEQDGGLAAALHDGGRLLVNGLPLGHEALDVGGQLLLGGPLCGGAHDDSGRVGHDPLEDLLQAAALGIRQLARDARHGAAGDQDQVSARQGDLAGEAGTLVADGVLGDLDQDGVAAGEGVLDAAGPALQAGGVPVNLAGIEDGVAPLAQVHEGSLHGGKDVLNPADIDVADHGGLGVPGDVVLHEEPVLQDGDLVEAVGLAHDHLPVHGLATGQELGLGDDGTTAPGRPALAAALALGLQAGGPLEGGHLVTQVATLRASTGATSPAARSGHGARGGLRGGIGGGLARGSLIGAVILRRLRLIIGVGARRALATRARAPTAPATAPLAAGPALADVLRRISPGLIGPIGTVRAISLRDLGGLGVGLVAGGVLAALLRGPGTGGGPPTPTAATATAVGSGGLGLSILVMSPGTGPRVGVLLIRPVLGALVTRGGRRLLGSGARRGDPTAPTGPAGVGGLEQERGGRKPGDLEVLLLIEARAGGLVALVGLGLLVVGLVGLGRLLDLVLEFLLRGFAARCVLGHARLVRLVGLDGDTGLGGGSLLRSGGGRDNLPAPTRRDRISRRSCRGLLHTGFLKAGGGDGLRALRRTGLLGNGGLCGGGRGRGDPAAAARSRGAHGLTVAVLEGFC